LQLIYPLLYGIYLILGLLALQPYQDIGLSPAGAICLFVLGAGLANFILAVGSFPGTLRVSWFVFRRVFVVSFLQVLGLGAFVAGLLTGSGFLFTVMALLYATVAGTVWARFVRSRSFSSSERLGVIVASLAASLFLFLDFSHFTHLLHISNLAHVSQGAGMGGIQLLSPHTIVSRALCLTGALLWGVGHFAYNPREVRVGRAAWSFWESVCSVAIVLALSVSLNLVTKSAHTLAAGFEENVLLIAPFILFGVVFGALRSRLVHAWEPKLTGRRVQLAWVGGAAGTAVLCGLIFLRSNEVWSETIGLAIIAFGIYLTRSDSMEISDYRGLRQVKILNPVDS
jgi:hypothetical protein